MKLAIALCLVFLFGCSGVPKEEPLDLSGDPRIGDSVEKACFGAGPSGRGGSLEEINGRPAFVVGDARQQYLLLFSRGCGDLGFASATPVFFNYGDNCRRIGDRVDTVRDGFRVTGGCAVADIREWNSDALLEDENLESQDSIDTPADGSVDNPEDGDVAPN